MGRSANAVLAYGYNLGDPEDWQVTEATGDYGSLVTDWYDENDDGDDFEELATTRLLASIGFTEAWGDRPGYHQRKAAAMAELGVHIRSCHYGESVTYLLVADAKKTDAGLVRAIETTDLEDAPPALGWDPKLRRALHTLGLTPKQGQPQWLLVATYF